MILTPAHLLVYGLIFTGLVLLGLSLFKLHRLYQEASDFSRAWIALYGLLVGGIVGYLVFIWLVSNRALTVRDPISAAVFLGSSLFIWLACRVSSRAVRENKRLTALERHRAAHDELTRLPNRSFFNREIDQTIKDRAGGDADRFAVLMMDLDRFKVINDTLGHYYGDILLQEVAVRLRQTLRNEDLLARLGGDEFGILIARVEDPGDLLAVGQHVVSTLERPFAVEGYVTDTAVSIGIASYPEHGTTRDTLMKNAEIAMYEAKKGPVKAVAYDEALDQHDIDHLNILGELRQAIESDALVVHYQPQVDARTGDVCGAEALVRWPHPRLGLLMPEEFISLAEQGGLIDRLNRWVLEIVLEQIEEWSVAGIEIPIASNLSVLNLQDPRFFDFVVTAMEARKLPPGRLKLEITESAIMADPEQALAQIRLLSGFGIRFAIDDFGTGYSSLKYLEQLPVSEIKIDKSFVINMMRDTNDALIIRSTIELAQHMGRTVIAEGVESREIRDRLVAAGCDRLQGYFIAEPMPARSFARWLSQQALDGQAVLRTN